LSEVARYSCISLVLPAYRQAAYLEGTVRGYEDALAKLPIEHEIIVVVNGPDDGSLRVANRLAQDLPAVRVVRREAAGWGGAVRVGLSEARGDLICYTNSARTSVDTLALLVECALRLPGIVVKANRRTRDSLWRHLGSLLYNLECRALFDLSNFDINGTPKLFPRALRPLLALESNSDLIDAEFLAACRAYDFLVLEVPVIVTRRHGGVSTTTAQSAVKMYLGAIALRWRLRNRPIAEREAAS
jgi:glycosyltransferase involved in cell wall biosynthesis